MRVIRRATLALVKGGGTACFIVPSSLLLGNILHKLYLTCEAFSFSMFEILQVLI